MASVRARSALRAAGALAAGGHPHLPQVVIGPLLRVPAGAAGSHAARAWGLDPSLRGMHGFACSQVVLAAMPFRIPSGDAPPAGVEARRGFAKTSGRVPKGMTVSPGLLASQSQTVMMQGFIQSPNKLAEPYRGKPPIPLSAYMTADGWKARWKRMVGFFKSWYTIARCKKDFENWSLKGFKDEASQLYLEVSQLLADGNAKRLEKLVSGAIYSDMKREIRVRAEGGWARVAWKCKGIDDVEIVHARMFVLDPNDVSNHFCQLTLRLNSRQTFAAYDKAGKLMAGGKEEVVAVQDFWVFERASKQADARWRIAGRLSLPPGS